MDDMTQEEKQQIEEMKALLNNAKPVPIRIQLTRDGFEFITTQLRILNKEKYRIDNGIEIVGKNSVLSKYEGRIILSDNSSEIINLREEK